MFVERLHHRPAKLMQMKCLIVLPCFNEEENVRPLVHSISEALKPQIPYKIIVVNDGSRDRTSEVLKGLSADYPIRVVEHETNMGLGAALRTGLLAAVEEASDDDFIVTMDSDSTHNPKHVLDMLVAAGSADVVVGSRYVKGGMQLNVPLHRVILSKAINFLAGKLFQLPLKDATSGFRCFRADLLKQLRDTFRNSIIESSGFVASLELLLKAVYSGGVVTEVPILLDYGRKGGTSKMRLFSTVISYLVLLFRYKRLNNLKHFG
jgi:dolichol-phosphate mannosyltransferase